VNGRYGGRVFQKFEVGGEFSRPQTGHLEVLAFAGATIEDIQMLADVVVRPGPVSQFEVGFDHVGDIAQYGSGTLLAIFLYVVDQVIRMSGLDRLANIGSGNL